MHNWHVPTEGSVCLVCMGGAVMAGTLKADRFEVCAPNHFETDTKNKLRALNIFRAGLLYLALGVLGFDRPRSLVRDIDVACYHNDPKQFKEDMRAIIEALKREGL